MYVVKMSDEFFLQVVLVANSLPALNDVTAMELPDIVAEAAKVCAYARTLLYTRSLYFIWVSPM